jgi:hypothetical protein
MKIIVRFYLIILLIASFCTPCFAAQSDIDDAKVFIQKFLDLSHKYDSALVDMYSDNAKIARTVIYKDGKVKEVTIPTGLYKNALICLRFAAKMHKYRTNYLDMAYKMEGENVRATGTRQSSSGYLVPVSILLGKDSTGQLHILEENTQTHSAFLVDIVFKLAGKGKITPPKSGEL